MVSNSGSLNPYEIVVAIREMIDSGAAAEMSSTAFQAYVTHLVKHADRRGRSWPGVETLAHEMGLGRTATKEANAKLVKDGWLKPTRPGGNGRASEYQVVLPSHGRKSGHEGEGDQGRESGPESRVMAGKPAGQGRKSGRSRPLSRPPTVPMNSATRTEPSRGQASAGGECRGEEHGEIRELLLAAGCGGNQAEASTAEAISVGWTAAEVRGLVSDRPSDQGFGWIRARLRDSAELEKRRVAERSRQAAQQRDEQAAQASSDREQHEQQYVPLYDQCAEEIEAALAAMDDRELRRRVRRALGALPHVGRTHGGDDPASSCVLRYLAYQTLAAERQPQGATA